MAVIAAGTMSAFYGTFHRILVDPWLACTVMLGYWGVVVAAFSREEGKPSAWAILTIYAAGGLAFLAKGPIGPALLGGPALIAIVVGKRWRFFRSWAHAPGAVLFLGLCALWPMMLYQRGGKALLDGFLIDNVVGRFTSQGAEIDHGGHKQSVLYYVPRIPRITFPWLIVLPALAHWLWRRRHPAEWNRPALLFMASVFPVGLLLLSVPGAKRQLYLLPLIAPLGVAVGAWLAATSARENACRLDRGSLAVLLGVTGLVLVGIIGIVAIVCLGSREFLERHHIYMHTRPSAAVVVALLVSMIVVVVGLGLGALSLWRRSSRRAGSTVARTVLALFVLGGPLLFVVSDSHRTLQPFIAELESLDGISRRVVGYKLDEVTVGLLLFNTGRRPKLARDGTTLKRWVRNNEVDRLLVKEKRLDEVPDRVRAQLRLIRKWPCAKGRTYLLFDIIPYAAPRE